MTNGVKILLLVLLLSSSAAWMGTWGYCGPRRWVYTLNRCLFWIWTAVVGVVLFVTLYH